MNQTMTILNLLLSGCRAGTIGGVSLTLDSYERGLWIQDFQSKELAPFTRPIRQVDERK